MKFRRIMKGVVSYFDFWFCMLFCVRVSTAMLYISTMRPGVGKALSVEGKEEGEDEDEKRRENRLR